MSYIRDMSIQEIELLEGKGVSVAKGDGTTHQVLAVYFFQLWALLIFVSYFFSNSWLIPVLPLVCLALDFLSGVVHWFFDTQIKPGPSRLGHIAVDFLDHHVRPTRTVEVGFVISAYRPAVLICVPLTVASFWLPDVLQATVFWIGALSLYVPQTHKMAHKATRNRWIRVAQSLGILLQPQAHCRHHSDYRSNFCVFTGWLNPLLDRTGFWRALEQLTGKPA